MENSALKIFFKVFLLISLNFVLVFSSVIICSKPVQAFFETQVQYSFKNRWLSMLTDTNQKSRFQAMRAFLVYPKWGLPVLRNTLISNSSGKMNWQIAMLIGMLGNLSDVPYLLKSWKELDEKKHAVIWMGAMTRLYRNNRTQVLASPKLISLNVKFSEVKLINRNQEKTAFINFLIKNPSNSSIFLRVKANIWKIRLKENLSTEYFWLKPGGKINSNIEAKFLNSENASDFRLDFRLWEVGDPKQLVHKTINVSL